MPELDVRGHSVPTESDVPSRQGWVLAPLLTVRDPIPVASIAARVQKMAALTAAGLGPSSSTPVFVFRADAGAGRELEYTTDGAEFWTVHAGKSTWTNINPAEGWAAPSVYQLPAFGVTGGMGKLAGGRIQRTGAAQAFTAGADVTVAWTGANPSRTIEIPTSLHFGEAVPTPGQLTLFATTGQLVVRSSATRTMPPSSASIVIVPPMEWPL